jgi:hypothetical protein
MRLLETEIGSGVDGSESDKRYPANTERIFEQGRISNSINHCYHRKYPLTEYRGPNVPSGGGVGSLILSSLSGPAFIIIVFITIYKSMVNRQQEICFHQSCSP